MVFESLLTKEVNFRCLIRICSQLARKVCCLVVYSYLLFLFISFILVLLYIFIILGLGRIIVIGYSFNHYIVHIIVGFTNFVVKIWYYFRLFALLYGPGYSSDNSGDGPNPPVLRRRKIRTEEDLESLDYDSLLRVLEIFVMKMTMTEAVSFVTEMEVDPYFFRDLLNIVCCLYDVLQEPVFEFDDVTFMFTSCRRLANRQEAILMGQRSSYEFWVDRIVRQLEHNEAIIRVGEVRVSQSVVVGMFVDRVPRWNRVVNAGARRRGGPVGNFLPGDPRHVDPARALQLANQLGRYGNPDGRIDHPGRDFEPRVPEWNNNWKQIENEFIHSDFPKVRSVFEQKELDDYGVDSVLLNPLGSPFCGMTAIDLAVGIKPKVDVYLKRCKYMNSPFSLGSNVELMKWAHYRGVNLRIIVPYNNVDLQDEIMDYMNDCRWKWVIIVVKDINGKLLEQRPALDQVNHAFLVVDEKGDFSNLDVPLVEYPRMTYTDIFWFVCQLICSYLTSSLLRHVVVGIIVILSDPVAFFNDTESSNKITMQIVDWLMFIVPWIDELVFLYFNFSTVFLLRLEYKFVEYLYNMSNHDYRNIIGRRDTSECHDHYAVMKYVPVLRFFGEEVVYVDSLYWLSVLGMESCGEKIISVVSSNLIIKETQLMQEEEMSLAILNQLKSSYANRVDSNSLIYLDTYNYCKWYKTQSKLGGSSRTQHMVAYAAQGSASYIANLNTIALNQLAVVCGNLSLTSLVINELNEVSISDPGVLNINNGFKKLNISKMKTADRKKVAWAPLGSCYSNKGQAGPGNVCVTEPCSLFAAMTGRSMVKLPVECDEFFKFSKEVLDWLVASINSSGVIIDEDKISCFKRINQGKRSEQYINSRISEYMDVVHNGKKNKKFFRNSCFVKLEDSNKLVKGKNRVRPRLIMTMSDYLSVELSPLIEIINIWNHSVFEQFQVKSMNPDDFVQKVASFTNRKHIVTDYSAFESSVSYRFKTLENLLIYKLYKKFKFHNTYRHFIKLHFNDRLLHSPAGIFRISSRCSGDYLTSTFNCVINFLINAYSAHVMGLDYRKISLIVEGDDGLTIPSQIDSEVINKLGFQFSANVAGSVPGDVDFLRKRWLYEGSLISVGRSLKNLMWVLSNQELSLKRQLTILRAKALSYYFMSPGHPIITSMINYILRNTAGLTYFKGLERYMSYSNTFDVRQIGKNYGTIPIREELRCFVAAGALGFDPIPVVIQLKLEENFEKGIFYTSGVLDGYDDFNSAVDNDQWYHNKKSLMSEEFLKALEIISMDSYDLTEYCGDFEPAALVYRAYNREDIILG